MKNKRKHRTKKIKPPATEPIIMGIFLLLGGLAGCKLVLLVSSGPRVFEGADIMPVKMVLWGVEGPELPEGLTLTAGLLEELLVVVLT